MSASADNPCAITVSANSACDKDQEMVQSFVSDQIKSSYYLLSKGSLRDVASAGVISEKSHKGKRALVEFIKQ